MRSCLIPTRDHLIGSGLYTTESAIVGEAFSYEFNIFDLKLRIEYFRNSSLLF
jgi:hypothetical protein